jgi:hypothetical protein
VRPRRQVSASTQIWLEACTSYGQTEVVVGIKLSWQVINYQTREHEGNGDEKSCRMSIVCCLEPKVVKSNLCSAYDNKTVDIRQGLHVLQLE